MNKTKPALFKLYLHLSKDEFYCVNKQVPDNVSIGDIVREIFQEDLVYAENRFIPTKNIVYVRF